MLGSMILLAAGVLFLAGTITLLCLKKMPLRWGISLILCGAILCGAGGLRIKSELGKQTEEYGCIYMALRYLERGASEPAALYLQRSELRNDYHLLAAQVLLEQVRGNDTMAKVRMDILQNNKNLTPEQEDGIASLRTWSPEKERSLARTVDNLIELLPLQKKALNTLEEKFEVESGQESDDWRESGLDEVEGLRLEINQAVGTENWDKALECAVELVHQSPTAENRLLLASVIAELTYFNTEMETRQFAAFEKKDVKDTKAEEQEVLTKEYERLQRKLEVLQLDISDADAQEAPGLIAQEEELSRQVEEAGAQAENIFAYRALNSIIDVHTLEAQIIRAKLYFAIHNYQQAIDMLCETANSLQAKLSSNRQVADSLKILQQVYESGNAIGTDSDDFQTKIQILMGSAHPDLINFSISPVSRAFAKQVADEQKNYSDGLYVMGFDTSNYPQISVQLGGQESVIQRIAEQQTVSASDTRKPLPTYQVSYKEGTAALSSICFVVDVSGSMGGSPLDNAKEALYAFLDKSDGYTETALVSFESQAYLNVALTTSTSQLKSGVDALYGSGGTAITTGIQEGTRALADARGAKTMILMTDGQSSVDMDAVQEAVEQGIVIFTIGFGDVNDELLMQIADITGGQYIRAESSDELVSVYRSLSRVVGNVVTITYTASDSQQDNRYFYMQEGKSGLSVREDYTLAEEQPLPEQTEQTPLIAYQPIMVTKEQLNGMLERQQEMFYVYLQGDGLEQVTSANINGLICTVVNQGQYRLELGIPCRLAKGVFDLTFKTKDGGSFVKPRLLWIGDSVPYRTYLAGGLEITANQGLLLPDQSLVLGRNVDITDRVTDETKPHTLSVELEGALVFSNVTLPAQTDTEYTEYNDQLALGEAGSALCYGVLSAKYNDGAYDRYTDETIYSGNMTLQYSADKSQIMPSEVSAS